MAVNSSPSLLDNGQIIKKIFDGSNDSIRISLGSSTGIEVSLDSASGDSVTTVPNLTNSKTSITSASTGVIVPAFSCTGMKSFNLYTITTGAITGTQACTLEVSPSDIDNVWIATTLTVTPNASNAVVVMGTANSAIVARRARVSIASAIGAGTFDIYVVAQAV